MRAALFLRVEAAQPCQMAKGSACHGPTSSVSDLSVFANVAVVQQFDLAIE